MVRNMAGGLSSGTERDLYFGFSFLYIADSPPPIGLGRLEAKGQKAYSEAGIKAAHASCDLLAQKAALCRLCF